MRAFLALLVGLAGACTDDGGGEPAVTNIDFHYGGDTPKLDTGAAIVDKNDPTKMDIQLGASGVTCDVDLESFMGKDEPPHTTALVMQVPMVAGMYPDAEIAAMKIESLHFHLSGTQGPVTIDAVGDRITGSVEFHTQSDSVGDITASGTFDVLACF